MVTVRVPATTANMGPGFDALGCALSLYARFAFEEAREGFEIRGCPEAFRGPDNLVFKGYRAAMERLGLRVRGLRVRAASDIPVARGLGSSAACLAAGAAAAWALAGSLPPREELEQITAAAEGHPDNASPAVHGGMRVAVLEKGRVVSLPVRIHLSFRFLALVPGFELATALARRALPRSVPLEDAVFNLSRAALLVKALEAGDPAALGAALKDRLHQPCRYPLIAGGETLAALAEAEGAAVFISGAGPTLMCLYTDEDFPKRLSARLPALYAGWQALPLRVDAWGLALE